MHTAEDLTQETFAAAWEKIGYFEGKSTVNTWLHKIAYNKFIDSLRGSNRIATIVVQASCQQAESVRCTPLDEVIEDEQTHRLYTMVQSLVESDRAVIVLHYFQGMSFSEIANVLDEPVGTIKWRTSEALKRLRKLLMA